jgi:hypothetical protein
MKFLPTILDASNGMERYRWSCFKYFRGIFRWKNIKQPITNCHMRILHKCFLDGQNG